MRIIGAFVGLLVAAGIGSSSPAAGVVAAVVLVPLGWGLGARLARRIKGAGNRTVKVKP